MAAAVSCLLLATTFGCTDDPVAAPAPTPSVSTTPTSPVPELQPGAPGEGNSTRDPGDPIEEPDAAHDDIAFMQMMVLHHRQALEMAALVPDRSSSQQVRDVAARIEAAQSPEILVMAQWLTERSLDVPGTNEDPALYDHSQHGHAGMEGMLTDGQLDTLEDADGEGFDRLFLADMIGHHEGALAMAAYVLVHGADARVNQLATDITAEQSVEIGRLERILSSVGP